MKVLVTGGGGYIGTVLSEILLEQGCEVICLDRMFFGRDKVEQLLLHPRYSLIRDDIRTFDRNILKGVDCVFDLAALSNDPLGCLVEAQTFDINHKGRARVCVLSKEMGVKRYVFVSSCSVYGFNDGLCTEETRPNPISAYAKASLLGEGVLKERTDSFSVTVVRLATVFGVSPRMRFDLAVNLMTLNAFKNGRIDVLGQGMQWRPFVHVRDVARTFVALLGSDTKDINGQIFNVGDNTSNIKVISLAYLVRELVPFEIQVNIIPDDPDRRSYRVSFDKLKSVLGVAMQHDISFGVHEIYEALKKGDIWDSPDTITVRWYKYLLDSDAYIKTIILDGKLL